MFLDHAYTVSDVDPMTGGKWAEIDHNRPKTERELRFKALMNRDEFAAEVAELSMINPTDEIRLTKKALYTDEDGEEEGSSCSDDSSSGEDELTEEIREIEELEQGRLQYPGVLRQIKYVRLFRSCPGEVLPLQ
jgi:hypothetical protein